MSKQHTITVGALGLPVNQEGEYLLALRNDPKRKQYHEKWEIVGGGLEVGESLEECMLREVEEEIAVTPKILFPYPIIHTKTRQKYDRQQQLILACYLVSLNGQTPAPNHQEILDVKWYKPAEIADIDALPLTHEFVNQAQEIRMHIFKNLRYNTNTGEGTSQ